MGRVTPVMSTSWKASVPSSFEEICPVMQTSGHRVHHGRGDAGDQVGGAGAGGGNGDADFAGGARISVGRMGGALLVADQDVADRVFAQSVVDGQDRSTGIAEYFANALAFEGGPDDLSAGEARGLAGGGCRYFAHYGFLLK